MAKKPLSPPSIQSIQLVLQAAESAPRPNGPVSRQLDQAVMEVDRFFQALLKPQAQTSDSGSTTPQASAS